ncbi:MAG: GH92 family glycosyl hydrolase [Sedimentisphaeraceae bacterium JB056]
MDDNSSEEFHLYADKELFTDYYPGNISFDIMRDEQKNSFPAYLPGPEDKWAGHMVNKEVRYVHELKLLFDGQDNYAGSVCELVLDFVDRNSESPMLMFVDVNGYRKRYWMDCDTKYVRFPVDYIKQGENKIILTPLSSTFVEWDCLKLVVNTNEVADRQWEDYPITPVQLVDPTYHTGYYIRVFESKPGAGDPYAMIHSSPDTGGGSYWYGSDSLAGIRCLYDYCLGAFRLSATPGKVNPIHYGGHIDKQTEVFDPGYWDVHLDRLNTRWEGTGTTYCSLLQFTSEQARSDFNIYFDAGERIAETQKVHDAFIELKPDTNQIEGWAEVEPAWGQKIKNKIYFCAEVDTDEVSLGTWDEQHKLCSGIKKQQAPNVGGWMTYDTKPNQQILVKMAVSYNSIDDAWENMHHDLPGWDFTFDQIHTKATETWNDALGQIEVEGGSLEDRRKFYNLLWEILIGRPIVSDADGEYCYQGEKKHSDYHHFQTDALWHSYWNWNQVLLLAYPEWMQHWAAFCIDNYEDTGFFNKAMIFNEASFMMEGAHSIPLVAAAAMNGIDGLDLDSAMAGMHKTMTENGNEFAPGLYRGIHNIEKWNRNKNYENYMTLTVEYEYNHWCTAQLAKKLERKDLYQEHIEYADAYKSLYYSDEQGDFLRSRKNDGLWSHDFDPYKDQGTREGNSFQYAYFVPHDLGALAALYGKDDYLGQWDKWMSQAEKGIFSVDYMGELDEEQKRASTVNIGNQPCGQFAWLGHHGGKPSLSMKWNRVVWDKFFGKVNPYGGMICDNDEGQLGGVGVLSAIGLFSPSGLCSTEPYFLIGSPVFDKIIINLDGKFGRGRKFEIECRNLIDSESMYYVQDATLNGKPISKAWIFADEIYNGGKLILNMGETPSKWGEGQCSQPPN